MMLAIACGMNGVVLVTDIFSLYVFMEITAVASFILIAFFKDIDALEGAFKYIMLSAFATALMLVSISLILLVSGSTGFSDISASLKVSQNAFPIMFAISIFIVGLFIKAGLMPFHGWLPDAYSSAPAPVSVLLAGIVTKTVGVYTLMRLTISVFGFSGPIQHVFLLVATISIVLAALAAIGQTDFKRMLAYSSISQIGYIILGLGCATPLGIAGAIFHLFNHAIFKSLLFVNAASVESQAGTRDMTKMGGLAAKMPVTGATSILASLSAAGVPPMAGFWSKLMIITALWVSGNRVYAVIAILASVITLGYFLYMQRTVFFGKLNQEFKDIKEAGWGLVFPSIMLGAIILAVGFVFPFLWKWGG
jgi:multicomponent Na+:H+ antiporter subunit D